MRFMTVLAAAVVLASPAAAQEIAPVMVYFEAKAGALDPNARTVLDQTATQVRRTGGSMSVVVSGHADGSEGSHEDTVRLSQWRAGVVREYLVSRGVAADMVLTQAYGATRPAIETTEPTAANRRVEITFGPGSGW